MKSYEFRRINLKTEQETTSILRITSRSSTLSICHCGDGMIVEVASKSAT